MILFPKKKDHSRNYFHSPKFKVSRSVQGVRP